MHTRALLFNKVFIVTNFHGLKFYLAFQVLFVQPKN